MKERRWGRWIWIGVTLTASNSWEVQSLGFQVVCLKKGPSLLENFVEPTVIYDVSRLTAIGQARNSVPSLFKYQTQEISILLTSSIRSKASF